MKKLLTALALSGAFLSTSAQALLIDDGFELVSISELVR